MGWADSITGSTISVVSQNILQGQRNLFIMLSVLQFK